MSGEIPTTVVALERHEGRSETLSEGRWRATRAFKVAWADRMQFTYDVLYGGSGGSQPSPHQYPDVSFPTWAKSVSIKPIGTSGQDGSNPGGQSISFSHCIVTVTYESPGYDEGDTNDETIIKEGMNLASQGILVPGGTYTFSGGGKLEEDFPLMVGSIEWSIDISNWGGFDATDIVGKLGRINSSTYRGWAAKKLLFQSASATREYITTGLGSGGWTKWDVSYKFLYREYEWDKAINPASGDWETLTPSPYETSTFSGILPF